MTRDLLDTDLYKLTMQYAVMCHYPRTLARYEFINRGKHSLSEATVKTVFDMVSLMSTAKLSEEQVAWLGRECPYFPKWYLDWLLKFRPNPKHIRWENGTFVVEGPWEETIWFEVPVLATISEAWSIEEDILAFGENKVPPELIEKVSRQKGEALSKAECPFIEMGTRRRRSFWTQDLFLAMMKILQGEKKNWYRCSIVGTSNVHLAWKRVFKPMGTMAHEWIMAASVLEGERHANRHALRKWRDTFKGQLGIALTDTYTTHSFFKDFDADLAHSYTGVRQDSGNPSTFADRMLEHYENLGIDPRTKTIVFSDGLTCESAAILRQAYLDQGQPDKRRFGKVVFGIGTHLTNDFPDRKAMNIVMKLTHVNNVPVVKLSDVPGKASGDPDAKRVALWIHNHTPLDAKVD